MKIMNTSNAMQQLAQITCQTPADNTRITNAIKVLRVLDKELNELYDAHEIMRNLLTQLSDIRKVRFECFLEDI